MKLNLPTFGNIRCGPRLADCLISVKNVVCGKVDPDITGSIASDDFIFFNSEKCPIE